MAGKLSFLKSQLFNMPESINAQETEIQTLMQKHKKNQTLPINLSQCQLRNPGLSHQADCQDPRQPCHKHNNILKLTKTAFYTV